MSYAGGQPFRSSREPRTCYLDVPSTDGRFRTHDGSSQFEDIIAESREDLRR